MLIISLIRLKKINRKPEFLIQENHDTISNLMHHIVHQSPQEHPSMWDAKNSKICNQLNPVYLVYQPYLMKHARATL